MLALIKKYEEYDVGFDFKGFIISSGRWYICEILEKNVKTYYNGKRYTAF